MEQKLIIPCELIEARIFIIRGKKVMIDRDLAQLYEVSTKRLNEQVKRNLKRFPEDFMFRLTREEKDQLVAICDRFTILKHATVTPYVFAAPTFLKYFWLLVPHCHFS